MCLQIPTDYVPKLNKPVIVYKVYNTSYNRKGKENKCKVYCLYQDSSYCLRPGKFITSNRETKELSYREKNIQEVNKGFHVFTRKKEAAQYPRNGYRIAKFEGYPEHFVAKGFFGESPSMVFTKLRFIGFIE